nr:right-handed parallel beta-helix repeat-containing protein [Methanobacterium petrolearium]
MFNGAGANYYATAWNDAEIVYDFLDGASNFQDANNQNREKITTSTLYNGVQVWRNDNGYTAFVGDWNGVFPSVAQTTAYDKIAADAWYHGDRNLVTTLYVDANLGNDSWNGTSATFIGGTTGPMKTITAAINALTSWGTINVASGTYNENLVINKTINLKGSGENTVLTPSNLENPIINITISGNASVISGFIISGATTSSAIDISGASGCTVTNNNITGNQIGIRVSGSSNTISSNNISGNNNGVYCDGNNQKIKNNTITQSSTGVTVENSENVEIEDNRITSNAGTGVTIKNSNNTAIKGNNISDNHDGVEISDNSAGNVVDDNTITDNQDSGIEIQQSQNNQIKQNTIHNNVQTGIKLNQSNGNNINGNNINGSSIGVDLQNSNYNTISGNTITAKTLLIKSSNSYGNTITNNRIIFDIPMVTNAAGEVAVFVEITNRLPDNIVIGGINVSMPSFLRLLTTVTQKIYNNDLTPVDLVSNYRVAVSPKDNQVMGYLSVGSYVSVAGRVQRYMDRYMVAPNYSSYSILGSYFGYENLIYTYSKILDTYNSTGVLPANVQVVPWSFVENFVGSFSVDETVDAAGWVQGYIESNGELPGSVVISGTTLNGVVITTTLDMPVFLRLLTTVTQKIYNNDFSVTVLAGNYGVAVSPRDNQVMGYLSVGSYVSVAGRVQRYMDRYMVAPNYSSYSTLGSYFGYENLIYTYSKILATYNTTKTLPVDVQVVPWSFVENFVGSFSVDETVDAAGWVQGYIESNGELPGSVVISGISFNGTTLTTTLTMPAFLRLLTTVTQKIYNNDFSVTVLAGNYRIATSPRDNQVMGYLSVGSYVSVAGRVQRYMDRYMVAPNYSSYSTLGSYFGYENLIYTYSKILDTYNSTGVLPANVQVVPWSFVENFVGSFSVDETVDAASWVQGYIESNGELPGSVVISGISFNGTTLTTTLTMPVFLRLLTTVVPKVYRGDLTFTVLAGNYRIATSPRDNQVMGYLSVGSYVSVAGRVQRYMDRYMVAPNYSSYSTLGSYFGYENLIYTYSKILATYNTTKTLPVDVQVVPWSFVENFVGSFSVDETVDAASWVQGYIESNGELPGSVVISGISFNGTTLTTTLTMPVFLRLLTTVTQKIYNNDFSVTVLAGNYGVAVSPRDNQKMGYLSVGSYVSVAGRVQRYMDRYMVAPNYSSYSTLGSYFGYENLIYTYSKILNTYNTTKTLPANIAVRSWIDIISLQSPSSTVKLTFIHHSCGSNWLADGNGNLGTALNANNYYVTDTNYGWDAEPDDNLGDHTNTDDWYLWFNDVKMPYVYSNNAETVYTNTITNPDGENEIIMFKSCYPLSEVGSSIDDEKTTYNNLKTYFTAHPDKMFILITPPGEETVSSYQLTRELCDWLVDAQNGWLSDYSGKNVYVFDLYCVLSEVNSHHRCNNGQIEHVYASDYDGVSPYHNGDDHPNSTGNQKATEEFITFLDYAYTQWKS